MKNTQNTLVLSDILGPLIEFFTNLMGKNGVIWLDAFKRFLRKENPWINTGRWKIWTTATMGAKIPLSVMKDLLLTQGFQIRYSDTSPFELLDLNEVLQFNEKEEEVFFTLATPKDLGLKPGWTKRQLLDVCKSKGLSPMLSGDILEILSQGKFELHKGDHGITIAMEAITIGTCKEAVFCIAKYDYLHLGYSNGDPKQLWTYPTNVNNPHLFRIDTSCLNP